MLLAIDPGENSGWAVFDSARRLKACGLSVDGSNRPTACPYDRILIEVPKFRGRIEKNPQSLLVLSRNAGRWSGRYEACGPVEEITPNDWKGQTPKDVSHRRIFSKLDASEIGALVKACIGVSPRSAPVNEAIATGLTTSDRRSNILDAIGIGLFGVHR